VSVVVLWSCAVVLLALAARSAARLLADRTPVDPDVPACSLTSRTGDVIHLATAIGMVAMVVPLGLPPVALTAFFGATTAYSAGAWALRVARRRLAVARGGTVPCRPAHALEPHHLIVGLAMIAMTARMSGSGIGPGADSGSMIGMAGTSDVAASTSWLSVGTLSLLYVWSAVLVLGNGLVKAVSAQPASGGAVAILAAPVTIYACELAMTVVMGLMLLG
jgi:hypothetical protein